DADSLQRQIALHVPIDTDARTLDIEIDLPDPSALQVEQFSAEDRAAIERLMLDGSRYGRVQAESVDDLCDRSDRPELRADLLFALAELGVQVETALEWPWPAEPTDDIWSEESGDSVDEAIDYLQMLAEQENDLLKLYYKDMGPRKVLSLDEEAELA
ncbi:sigma-70 region 2 domain protein, partial [mine drainage metagenome]